MMRSPALLPFGNRRYRLLKRVGAGGMGQVYQAYDRLTQQNVAIKRIHLSQQHLYIDEALALRKLAHEFSILAGLHHPNIIHVRGYGFENRRQPFLVMDYLEDAVDLVTATQQADFDRKIDLFIQILQALVYLHRHQIVHRDLKPANVLVTPQGEIRLVDFGLASGIHPDAETAIGSLAYMSPEALRHQPVGIPADLNAVGVLAYECFTGTHPYMASSVSRTMSNILNASPDVGRLMYALSDNHALAQVIRLLLRKKPDERCASAQQALADLCQAVGRPLPEETQIIRESYLQSALFIGREQELTTLRSALQEVHSGQGTAWLLGGESGVGKSRLLEQVRTQALIDGFMVVRGTALQDGSLTYQLWRGVVPHLLLEELTLPTEDIALLREIVPNIEALLEVSVDAPRVDLHAPTLEALIVDLLLRREQPILVLLEDLHWARDQWSSLNNVIEASQALPVVFLATYRTNDTPELPGHLPSAKPLYLSRFSLAEIEQLITSILGQHDVVSPLVKRLYRETDGNAFYLLDILRSLAEHAGGLEYISVSMVNDLTIASPSTQQMMQRRLDLLLLDHLPMLRLAALAGRQLDFNLLRYVDNEMDYDHWLSDCAEASILEHDAGEWRFVHDKIRQGMLYRVDDGVKAKLHRMVAEAIEAVYWDQPGYELRLSEQWRGAGDFDREMQYLLLHMEWLANIRHFNEITARLQPYLARLDSIDHPSRDVYRAEVLLLLGRAAIAMNDLETGLEDVSAGRELALSQGNFALCARCDVVRSRVQLYQARYDRAEITLQAGFTAVEQAQDRRLLADLLCLDALLLNTHSSEAAEARVQQAAQLYEDLQDHNGLAEVANILGQIAASKRDFEQAIQFFEDARRLYLENQNAAEVLRPLNNLGVLLRRTRRYAESVAYLTQCLDGARRYHHLEVLAAALRNLGRTYIELDSTERALECFTEVLPLRKAPGHERQLFIISMEMALIYLRMDQVSYSQIMVWQARSLTLDPFDDEMLGWVIWYGANFAFVHKHLMESIALTGSLMHHFGRIDSSLENSILDFRQRLEASAGAELVANVLARSHYTLQDSANVVFETHLRANVT